jgi:hypothetical protein
MDRTCLTKLELLLLLAVEGQTEDISEEERQGRWRALKDHLDRLDSDDSFAFAARQSYFSSRN